MVEYLGDQLYAEEYYYLCMVHPILRSNSSLFLAVVDITSEATTIKGGRQLG